MIAEAAYALRMPELVRSETGVRPSRAFLLLAANLHHDPLSAGRALPGIVAQPGEHLLLEETDTRHSSENVFFRAFRTLHGVYLRKLEDMDRSAISAWNEFLERGP